MSLIIDGDGSGQPVALPVGSISPAIPLRDGERLTVTADATTSVTVEYALDAETWVSWPPGTVSAGTSEKFYPRRKMFARLTSLGVATFVVEAVPDSDLSPPYYVKGAAVADAAGGVVIDAEARTAVNALLAQVRATGVILT